jgi:hypothetical protein
LPGRPATPAQAADSDATVGFDCTGGPGLGRARTQTPARRIYSDATVGFDSEYYVTQVDSDDGPTPGFGRVDAASVRVGARPLGCHG